MIIEFFKGNNWTKQEIRDKKTIAILENQMKKKEALTSASKDRKMRLYQDEIFEYYFAVDDNEERAICGHVGEDTKLYFE